MKKHTFSKLTAAIITIALIAILLSQIEVADVVDTLTGIEPVYLVAGFGLYVLSYFFRALRFHILLNKNIGIKNMFNIVCVHNMANNILPARTGEFSYAYFIKKMHNVPIGVGVASLVIVRVFDFITISLIFFVSAMFTRDLPEVISKAIWIIAGVTIFMVLILIALANFGNPFMDVVTKIINRVNGGRIEMIKYLLQKTNETVQSFKLVNSKQVIWLCIFSMLIWFCNYSMGYILIKEMGIGIPIWEILIGFTFSVFASILPIRGICGFGTSEGVWTIVFMSLGVSKQLSIASGFGYHILLIIYYLIIGCYGMMRLKTTKL